MTYNSGGPGDDDRTVCERTVDDARELAAGATVAVAGTVIDYLTGNDYAPSRRDSRIDDEDGDLPPASPFEDAVDDVLDFLGF